MPRLSIIVPTFNAQPLLQACLLSVLRYRPTATEVIVVDDASTDGTAEWLRATHPHVRVIRSERNQGFCRSINAGIRAARAPIIQTLNNDTVVMENWAESALELFADPSVGSVAPQIWLMRDRETLDSAGDIYHLCGYTSNRGHGQELRADFYRVAEVFGASASAAFYRREALERVGGFPEHFEAYYDDVDVAFRLRWAGYRCLYSPSSRVLHQLHGSYDHSAPRTIYLMARNEERVFWANLPPRDLAWAILPHLGYIVGCGLAKCIMHRNFLAYLQGKLAILLEASEIRRQRECVRNLAAFARFPVHHPIDSSLPQLAQRLYQPVARILRRLRKTSPLSRPRAYRDAVADQAPPARSRGAA
jgi:GT2 family glycosyltransferase